MSIKTVSAAACCCCPLLLLLLLLSAASAVATSPVAVAVAARVLKQLTVSDQQLILKLCMSVCARVFGYGRES